MEVLRAGANQAARELTLPCTDAIEILAAVTFFGRGSDGPRELMWGCAAATAAAAAAAQDPAVRCDVLQRVGRGLTCR